MLLVVESISEGKQNTSLLLPAIIPPLLRSRASSLAFYNLTWGSTPGLVPLLPSPLLASAASGEEERGDPTLYLIFTRVAPASTCLW